jgi:non-ribosomal peptide synthetase component F
MRLVGATDTAELPLTRGEDPAHVFFSTDEDGIHKGVLGCHKALSHFATWQRNEFAINSGDRLTQLTPISNDTVLCEIMTPLISGATVCITDDEVLFCGDALLQWLDDQHITMIHAAPALASHWLSDLTGPATLNSLRLLFFKDEPLTNSVVRRWQHAAPNARIINLYGPTETTLAKTWHDASIDAHVLHDAGIQPIGKALPQTQVLLLNEYEQVCGIGETGQIVIRTPHRSMGFINPYESNEGFAPNPYTDDLSDLFFETGDIGRYRPDGSIRRLAQFPPNTPPSKNAACM